MPEREGARAISTITTLRPSATSSGVGWTPSTGTLHGVTSDDSDATYAEWSGSGSAMILATSPDAPPMGERRHLVRIRARGEDGSAWWAVRLATGQVVAGASASFDSSPETVAGSWQAGAPADGSTTLSCFVEGQSTGLRIVELFLDVDTRAAPTFTPQILDGSGTPITTITDTVTPIARVSALDLDGLPARQYRYWVTQGGATVWDTGVVSGNTVDRQVDPLENGTYTLHMQVWSTLGANTSNPSEVEELEFTMAVGAVPAPTPPSVTPEEPFYRVEVCAPNTTGFDDYVAWLQLQRVDCPHGGYLDLNGLDNSYASTPDAAVLDITGDLEVTIRARRDDGWRPEGGDQTLISKYLTTGDQRSWRLSLDWDGADNGSGADEARAGRPFLAWSPDGTLASLVTAFCEERAPINPFGEVHLRAFLDVDNGSGNWEVTFESLDGDGQWQPIGSPVIGSGTTSIHSGSAELAIGAYAGGTVGNFEGRIYEAQVRSGRSGPIVASPDFTSHPAGTVSFDDDQSNTWTVGSAATITSSQQATTLAILGPVASGECEEWVDFTIPRSGVGRTCDHDPEPCCSYYRARTVGRVDGSILVSGWSDAFNPGIPRGVVFMWPGEDGSIPRGWNRVTELDGRYTKGIPNSITQPGATGGNSTHSHLTPGHAHSLDHSHETSDNTGTAQGTFRSNDGVAGTLAYPSSHTHTRPSTGTASVNSQSASPGTSSVDNDPARLEVIWIGSTGSPLGVPDGALALMPDISPSSWDTYADATNRFLKGAAAGQNAGTTAASQIDSHTHGINSHTHGGTPHSHTSGLTGFTSGTLSFFAGPNTTTWTSQHRHEIDIGNANTASLQSASGGTSGSQSPNDPPYRNLRVRQNNSGAVDLPIGLIAVWRGSLDTIPDGWELCDGNNGTPDLTGRYPRGAETDIGDPGGGLAPHNHTSPSHDHPSNGHSHSSTIGPSLGATADISSTQTVTTVDGDHTHSSLNTDSESPTVGQSSSGTLTGTTTEPPFEEVAFIQLQTKPEPPPEPETFCLEWSENEHLIRTYGPNGPMYFGVWGMFEWGVERPFTAATGVMGSRFVNSAPPGGRNLRMVTAVESEAELAALRAVLARPLVLISPSDSTETWAAPVAESIRVVKIGRIREVRAEFIATGPEPEPQVADVGV